MTFAHKGEELKACHTAYERALLCLKWQEEARDAWYQGKLDAYAGKIHVVGQKPDADPINREIAWKQTVKARDLVGLEQMYGRWATMYFQQVTAETLVLSQVLNSRAEV